MAGQMIVLEIDAAAGSGAPRIDMTGADAVAAKVASLKHVVSPRAMSALPAGGVSGRCRSTGLLLTPKGTQATALVLSDIGGKRALGLTAAGAVASLALPAGSMTDSFTLVFAVNTGAADLASGSPVNYISGFDGSDAYTSATLRYYGAAAAAPRTNRFVSVAPSATGTETFAAHSAAGWAIVIIDFDNNTRALSIAVNQAETFNTVTKGASITQDPNAYFEIGYHVSGIGLRSSKVGDLFTFGDSLLASSFGRAQLADLVAALKTEYGIA